MDSLIATARSNGVSTCLAVQDFSQLKKDYGSKQEDVIIGIVGNVISGQVTGSTAKSLRENFGKITQAKDIPMAKKVTAEMVEENYRQIKREIFELLRQGCAKMQVKNEVVKSNKIESTTFVITEDMQQIVPF